jgi:adenylate kinase
MKPWERVAVVGIPGVGKTSLCRASSLNSNYQHINYGELMLEIAQKMELATNLPEMFLLDISIQHTIWKQAALQIKDEKNVLLDLHGVDSPVEGYLISLPFKILPPDIIIIIESSYENILQRRSSDLLKERFIERRESLKNHMQILRFTMSSISSILGCNLAILNNDNFEICLKELEVLLGINIIE